MINIDYLNPRMLIASMGRILTNGEVYTTVVYLGKDEDVDNWKEIDENETLDDSDISEDTSDKTIEDDSTDTDVETETSTNTEDNATE